MKQILQRAEVDQALTWDLSSLFSDDAALRAEMTSIEEAAERFCSAYKGKLQDAETAALAIEAVKELHGRIIRAGTYAQLRASTDSTDNKAQSVFQETALRVSQILAQIQFLTQELRNLDEETLVAVKSKGDYETYIDEILRNKPHALQPDVEEAVSRLSPIFDLPYTIYNRAKLADLRFPSFLAEGVDHPMSFGLFEGHYENEPDTAVRRAAFTSFSEGLGKYRHTIAAALNAQMQKEKILATMRGFDSVLDMLLFTQNVDRSMYERQLKAIREDLPPVMRKFAGVIKEEYALDEMTYADLLVPLDPEFEPTVTVEDAKNTLLEALKPLGQDYLEIVERAFSKRWIDFVENEGKSTGAFCTSPYGAHPYVLISWSASQREMFVLAHELGHAGHFSFSQRKQNILHMRPSLYLIEAPSTMNELFVAEHLLANTDDARMKRWVESTMISRTYYHNFVTHGLEALFQKKAYDLVDRGESLSADRFDALYRETLEDFWGDAVEIIPGAERTWMRQPHYYMGLYPYTYSAGLTLGTAAYRRIKEEEGAVADWVRFLEAGGTHDVLGLAKIAGIDLSTDQPLKDTLQAIDTLVENVKQA